MQQFSSQTKLKVIFGSVKVEFNGIWDVDGILCSQFHVKPDLGCIVILWIS